MLYITYKKQIQKYYLGLILKKWNVWERLATYLKPRINGADRSPFSSRNLPKSNYKIPDEDFIKYKNIVAKIPKERILDITHTTNNYLKSLVTKKNTWEDIKADMILKGLKGKEYIYSIGKWDDYVKYLHDKIADNVDKNGVKV